jgi:hypothetical protein
MGRQRSADPHEAHRQAAPAHAGDDP